MFPLVLLYCICEIIWCDKYTKTENIGDQLHFLALYVAVYLFHLLNDPEEPVTFEKKNSDQATFFVT